MSIVPIEDITLDGSDTVRQRQWRGWYDSTTGEYHTMIVWYYHRSVSIGNEEYDYALLLDKDLSEAERDQIFEKQYAAAMDKVLAGIG